MAILLVAATLGLVTVNSQLALSDQDHEADEPPGGGTIVRSEVLRVRLPETLWELASLQSDDHALRDYNDLRSFLEQRHQEHACYALTVRGHQINGGHSDITFIRHPYDEPQRFQEVLDVLATMVGRPHRDTVLDFSTASVDIVADQSRRTHSF